MEEVQVKKSFWQIYTAVIVFYVAMIITYSVVVHNATEDGAAADVKPHEQTPWYPTSNEPQNDHKELLPPPVSMLDQLGLLFQKAMR